MKEIQSKDMKYKTVVFDLDGTLVNSIDDLTENINITMRQLGYPERTVDEVKLFVGNGIGPLIQRALPENASEEEIKKCFEVFKEHYLNNMHNQTKTFDGIMELLTELKKQGVKTSVVSNKLDEATKNMCNHFFGTLIDVAIGDNDEREKKPAADNVLEALRQLGSNQTEAIYVGDTKVDVATARNSQLPVVGVTWGYRGRAELEAAKADFIIDQPMELLKFFQS